MQTAHRPIPPNILLAIMNSSILFLAPCRSVFRLPTALRFREIVSPFSKAHEGNRAQTVEYARLSKCSQTNWRSTAASTTTTAATTTASTTTKTTTTTLRHLRVTAAAAAMIRTAQTPYQMEWRGKVGQCTSGCLKRYRERFTATQGSWWRPWQRRTQQQKIGSALSDGKEEAAGCLDRCWCYVYELARTRGCWSKVGCPHRRGNGDERNTAKGY